MLKTTRTRLNLMDLERRETPAKLGPIHEPIAQVEILSVATVYAAPQDSDAIKFEAKPAPIDETQPASYGTDVATARTKPPVYDIDKEVALKEKLAAKYLQWVKMADVPIES